MTWTGYYLKNYISEPTPASTIRTGVYVKSLKSLKKWKSAGQVPTLEEPSPSYVYPRQDNQLTVPFNDILTKMDSSTKSN